MGLFKREGSLKDREELSTGCSKLLIISTHRHAQLTYKTVRVSFLTFTPLNLSIQTVHELINNKLYTQILQHARAKRTLVETSGRRMLSKWLPC